MDNWKLRIWNRKVIKGLTLATNQIRLRQLIASDMHGVTDRDVGDGT
jgi:hypothetical protein